MALNWSLQHKRDTAANWTANNPVLLEGQLGVETDDLLTAPKFKIGDGVNDWNTLPYASSSASNLNSVLAIGNTTNGQDIVLTDDDIIQVGSTASRSIKFDTNAILAGLTLENLNSNDHIILQDAGGIHIDTSYVQLPQLTASRIISTDASNKLQVETGTGFLTLNAGVISYDSNTYLTTSAAALAYQPLDSDLTSWAGVTRASGFDTFTATPSSANLASLLTDETGTGFVVFSDKPTFTNWLTVPRIYGGAAVGDGIDYYSTSGNGTPSSNAHRFLGGNNGATTLLTLLNDGTIRIPNNRTIQGTDSAGTNRSLITWSAGDNITINGRPGVTDIYLNPTNGGIGLYVKAGGDGGIGVASPAARWHVIKTTEQLRIGYDTSNYYSTTVGSTGTVTFNAVGTGSKFVFSDNIELTQTVTTESVTSDTTVTIVINGVTYKLLAKA